MTLWGWWLGKERRQQRWEGKAGVAGSQNPARLGSVSHPDSFSWGFLPTFGAAWSCPSPSGQLGADGMSGRPWAPPASLISALFSPALGGGWSCWTCKLPSRARNCFWPTDDEMGGGRASDLSETAISQQNHAWPRAGACGGHAVISWGSQGWELRGRGSCRAPGGYGPVVAEGQEEASHLGMGAWGRSSAVWDRGAGREDPHRV